MKETRAIAPKTKATPDTQKKQSKEEMEEMMDKIKNGIQEKDQTIFAMGGNNLGWTKDEHQEFLAILSRWEVHYKLHSDEIEE